MRKGRLASASAASLAVTLLTAATTCSAQTPWASVWAPPARTRAAEQLRACTALDSALFVADTLLAKPDLRFGVIAAGVMEVALGRTERVFGAESEDADRAREQTGRAWTYSTDRSSLEGRRHLERVLEWREERRPPNDISLAPPLQMLARLYALAQEAEASRRAGMRAIAIIEAQPKVDSLRLSRALLNVSGFIARNGDERGALPLAERSVEIRRRMGARPEVIASALTNVCAANLELGASREAEPPCDEVYRIFQQAFGPEHIRTGEAAGNLGVVRAQLGDTLSAMQLYQQSLKARIRWMGPEYSGVGDIHSNMGALNLRMGRYSEAEREFREALGVYSRSVNAANHEALAALEGLGRSLYLQKKLAAADSAFREVLDRIPAGRTESLPGPVPLALVGRAEIQSARHEWSAARSSLARADSLITVRAGRDHIDRVRVLTARADIEGVAGARSAALGPALEACRIELAHTTFTLRALPEEDILRFRDVGLPSLDAILRLAEGAPSDTGVVGRAWDAVVAGRGLGRRELESRLRYHVAPGDSVGHELESRYREAARRANRLVSGALDPGSDEKIATALRDAELAGRELARHLAADERSLDAPAPTASQARRSLPRGAALVAFQRVGAADPEDKSERYDAFVQPANGTAARFVRLGAAAPIDAAIRDWRSAVEASSGDANQASMATRLGRWLGENVWSPLQPLLGRASRVFVVADGEMQAVAPWAWPGHGEIDSGPMLQLLDHEADLIGFAPTHIASGALLAIGDVDYGRSPAGHLAVVRSSHGDSVCTSFERLPASAAEIDAVGREWRSLGGGVGTLSGQGATVAAFRERAPHANVLHIATHTWALGTAAKLSLDPGPLRRVGIALASANLADTTESGVMTAAEIGTLDLRNVDLVVLSSCRSALGRPISDEGLLGLRSAFASAGARIVVASLWNVSDESTAFWMQAFYAALHADGGDVLRAVRVASRKTRDWSRGQGSTRSPYAWGAFTVSGKP